MYPFETPCFSLSASYTCLLALVWKSLSHVWLCDPIDCIACQASLSIESSRQKYWSGAIPFSRESSQPRGQTQVSCTAGGFVTVWVTRERLLCTDAQTWSLELALLSMEDASCDIFPSKMDNQLSWDTVDTLESASAPWSVSWSLNLWAHCAAPERSTSASRDRWWSVTCLNLHAGPHVDGCLQSVFY